MKVVPLFGGGVAGKSFPVTRQRRVNCYYEQRPDGDKTKIAIYGTPGTTSAFTVPFVPRGISGTQSVLYVVAGANFYVISPTGTVTFTAGMGTSAGFVSIAFSATQVVIVDGSAGYLYTPATGTFVPITSPGFPNGCRTVTFTSGYFVVEQPGSQQFWVSNFFDGSTWNALAFASASQYSDNILACDSLIGNVVFFCERHAEFWQNIGTSPEPFAPILAATSEYGLTALFSRAHINSTLIALCENPQGTAQVIQFTGYQVQVISTPDLEQIFQSFHADLGNGVAMAYVVNGHPMYQLTFPAADTGVGRSFLYDCSSGLWTETQTGVTANYAQRHLGNLSAYCNGQMFVTDSSTGNVYTLSDSVYTDNGSTIVREIITRHVSSNFNVMTVDEVYIDMETGVGLVSGQGSNPQIMLQVSKDNGRTWQTERWVTVGAIGSYTTRVVWRQFGSSRDFTFRLRLTDPVKFVITDGAMSIRERQQ